MDYDIQLVDIPRGKIDCSEVFQATMAKAPKHVRVRVHARGQTHTGWGTSWSGAYDTYEVYDVRRPDWPTEDAERWCQEVGWAVIEHLH